MNEQLKTENLERGVTDAREKLSGTLHEIRERVSPGRLVDDAVQFARHSGAGDLARGAGRTVREHPLPFVLMGAGLGWLLASRRSHAREDRTFAEADAGALQDHAYEVGERVGEKATAATIEARDQLARAREQASAAAARAGEGLGQAARRARGGAERGWTWATQEQPLALLGLGLVAGAAVGLALPRTGREDRLLGHRSDEFKERLRAAAGDRYERARAAAEDAYRSAIDDLDRRGLSADSLREAAAVAAEQARAALGGDEPPPARH